VTDLLLLEELHAHLPIGLLVSDAETLELLHARSPLPGIEAGDVREKDHDPRVLLPELAAVIAQVAKSGAQQHLSQFREGRDEREPRWWGLTVSRVDSDRWGRVVVTLATDLTDEVRARRFLETREAQRSTLRDAIAAVSVRNLASSLQAVADALLPVLQVDVATLRLLDADGQLHLVAASGLRHAERRRLALEPLTRRRLERMIGQGRHPLVVLAGVTWAETRLLASGDDSIGTLTIGARSSPRPPEEDLALLDFVAARLGGALEGIERRAGFLRSRSLELTRVITEEDQAAEAGARGLRPRELAILRLYGEGLGTDQIAELLVLSPHTVRTHVRNARRRLGVSSRADALALLRTIDVDHPT
jgi:DNA-binding CsgD family transcriptional regulator